ncbi:MmgE/PrpD family [Bordetella ansorpii]|uniref:MmgE/PrpD family n=1 Tax=Bordetella ansorpii TaxID=288768 RepID=A0A157SVW1_9BORD|nr:MmgE/PrpD family protein [Bordetella ansorpii]SAI74474.1 MmgE/PrpD family [Bordetella ansorpii]
MLRGRGAEWYLPQTSIKFWPCCRWIHYALTAFEFLVRTHRLQAEEIERIELDSFPMIPYPCFYSNQDPPNLVAAGFSFAHAAAMVVLRVPAGPEWFSASSMSGAAARAIRGKVVVGDDERGYDPANWGLEKNELKVPSRARVYARGTLFEASSDYALGDAWDDAQAYGEHDVVEKFRRLAASAAPGSGAWSAQLDRIVDQILHIEDLPDVRQLTEMLGAPA